MMIANSAGKEDGDGAARAELRRECGDDRAGRAAMVAFGALLGGASPLPRAMMRWRPSPRHRAREAAPGDQILATRTLAALINAGQFKDAVKLAAEIKAQGVKTPFIALVELVDRVEAGITWPPRPRRQLER